MAFTQPRKQGRNPFIFGGQPRLTSRGSSPLYAKDGDGVFPTFSLGGIQRTPPGQTLRTNTNTLQQPNYGNRRDSIRTTTNPPNEGGPGSNSLLGMASTAALIPGAVSGLKFGGEWLGEKTGLLDTNSQAINKMGLEADPSLQPEQFGPASGDGPHTQLGQDTPARGLDLGREGFGAGAGPRGPIDLTAPSYTGPASTPVGVDLLSTYSDQGAVGSQAINAQMPEPQTTATSGLGLVEEADPAAASALATPSATAVNGLDLGADAATNAAATVTDDIGGLTAQMTGDLASEVGTEAAAEVGTEVATEAASESTAQLAAEAVPFVNVLMAGYKAYKSIDRLAAGEDPAKVLTSLATLGISDLFWA